VVFRGMLHDVVFVRFMMLCQSRMRNGMNGGRVLGGLPDHNGSAG
jgi:hypothetical protein